jgi:MFS family permease
MTDTTAIAESESTERPLPFLAQVRSFERPFWAANIMELLERLAYYGVRVVVPIYIASSEDPGGLHFTNVQKGTILTAWSLMQTSVSMFAGGYADRYGRKRVVSLSIAIKMLGYVLMATQRSYAGFLIGCMTLAMGTAVFKPACQAVLVKGTSGKNASVGWGIFYEVVNIGGVLGPPLAGALHRLAWKWVFLSCAAIVSLNFLMLLTYEDDPGTGQGAPFKIFLDSISKILRPRLLTLILIMSGFWAMFMQLFDSLPNFIEEWTDSASVVASLGLHEGQLAHMTPRGLQVPQEWMINLDAAAIVLFVVPISAIGARMRALTAIWVGCFVGAVSLVVVGGTASGWLCLAGILLFSVAEMIGTPRSWEYFGAIAPKGEEALYMGYINVPVAVGWTLSDLAAGWLYDRFADKANLAIRYLREHEGLSADAAAAIARTEAMNRLQATLHIDARAATDLLWSTYHPSVFWLPFAAVGVATGMAMMSYARAAKRWTTPAN